MSTVTDCTEASSAHGSRGCGCERTKSKRIARVVLPHEWRARGQRKRDTGESEGESEGEGSLSHEDKKGCEERARGGEGCEGCEEGRPVSRAAAACPRWRPRPTGRR